jgi:hypothetical protein
MIIKQFETEKEWMENRAGKITGSSLGDIVILRDTGNEKIGFWKLLAEKLAKPRDIDEKPMDRGHELEPIAIDILTEKLGIEFDKSLTMWEREDDNNIAISPDGFTKDLTKAVEVKCKNSAQHIQCYYEKQYPKEHYFQFLQYFIVNDKLEELYVVMYDPSFIDKLQFHYFIITREEVKEDIEKYLEYQRLKLEKINNMVLELSF